ncbi:DUF29 domain-containing protein [Pseudoduganella aquatica]|uniref:DUF29 domain-containing protein n=1 Tax=Pseudoduganella aquatica TaxID=2660641 RepID=UPI001E329DA0|nr:DUF29 domain-containing protein [Pseudoduganella aquatica]
MLDFKDEPNPSPVYEKDFVIWLKAQADFLRSGRLELLDSENLIDELTSMANRERRELNHRVEVLIVHLLKCQFQPDHKTHSWENTVDEQRRQVKSILEDSPSLRNVLSSKLESCYQHALRLAARETVLPAKAFPQHLPYTLEQLLDDDFLP